MKLINPVFSGPVFALAFLLLFALSPANSTADGWTWAPDYPAGATLPDFAVTSTEGSEVTLNRLAGKNGTLLMFSRSTVW